MESSSSFGLQASQEDGRDVKGEVKYTPIQASQAEDRLVKEEVDHKQITVFQADDDDDVIIEDMAFAPVEHASGDSWDEFSEPDPDSSDDWLPSGSPSSSRASSPEPHERDPGSSRDPAPAGPKKKRSRGREEGLAWTTCHGEDSGWQEEAWEPNTIPFTASPGPRGAAAELDSDLPADFLELFLTNELLQHMVDQTNIYASQYLRTNPETLPHSRGHSWRPVSVPELKTFFGLTFLTGYVKKPNLELYWSVNEVDATPFFNKTMSRNRFQIIWKFLHCNNNASQDETDKVYKVRPVLDYIVDKFKEMYQPGQNICIDEGLMQWRGCMSFRVHKRERPVTCGLKSYMLRDSATGYCFNLQPYVGEAGALPEAVFSLLDRLSGHGYTLYLDSFYTSVRLCERLLGAQTNVCGTLRRNRGEPRLIREVTKAQLVGGKVVRHNKRVMVVAWKEKHVVKMVTTCHHDRLQKVEVWHRGRRERVPQLKPECVVAYNASMNGVDRLDQNLTFYPFIRRSLNWSKKFVAYLFQLSIFNAYVLYRARNPGQTKTLLEFIQSIVKSWTAKRPEGEEGEEGGRDLEEGRTPRAPYNTDPDSRLDGRLGRHKLELLMPTSRKSRPARRCRVCARRGQRRETKMWCRSCCVPLHPGECFNVYHTKKNYCV